MVTGCKEISKKSSIGCCAQLMNECFLCWRCTDFISSVSMMLVFDVEEESWRDSTPMGNGSFICTAQHEKKLCVIIKTYKDEEMIFGLWKLDMEQRVWRPVEFIPLPTIIGETNYHVWGGSEFFWVQEWNGNEKRYGMWVYDISHHSWLNLGALGTGSSLLKRAYLG